MENILNFQISVKDIQALLNLIGSQPTYHGWYSLFINLKDQAESQLKTESTSSTE